MHIDLNSDLGESYGPWTMGDDKAMLALVTSANVACGGHASDPETMFETLSLAAEQHVIVGAHPGYNDRDGFGRRVIPMSPQEIGRMVAAQVGALIGVAALTPAQVRYVKPHGALANLAARDADVAREILLAVRSVDPSLAILAISGTALEQVAKAAEAEVFSEIFADRAYLSSGQLVPRNHADAVIHDADAAADRLLGFLESGEMPVIDGAPITLDAHSICVHGDTKGAVDMAAQIRRRLEASGVALSPFVTV